MAFSSGPLDINTQWDDPHVDPHPVLPAPLVWPMTLLLSGEQIIGKRMKVTGNFKIESEACPSNQRHGDIAQRFQAQAANGRAADPLQGRHQSAHIDAPCRKHCRRRPTHPLPDC